MPLSGEEKEGRVTASIPVFWHRFQDACSRRFSVAKTEKRDRFILLLITSLTLTLLITPDQNSLSTKYKAGDIAISDVRAIRDYLIEDRKLTEKKLAEVLASTPVAYDFDTLVVDRLLQSLRKGIVMLEASKESPSLPDRESLKKSLTDLLDVDISNSDYSSLIQIKDENRLLSEVERRLTKVYKNVVVADISSYLSDRLHGISLAATDKDELRNDLMSVEPLELDKAREIFEKSRLPGFDSSRDADIIARIISRMLRSNMIYNRDRSEQNRTEAKESLSPVLIQIKRGEIILRNGDRVTPDQEMKLTGLSSATTISYRISAGAGVLGLIMVILYFPYRFAVKNIRKFKPSKKDIVLLALLTCGHFLMLKTLNSISATLGGAFPSIATDDYIFLFPFAATAIMVRIFINSEVALVYAAICAPLGGLIYNSLPVVIYSMLGSIIGAHGVRHCENRSIIFTAGIKVSVVNLALALSFLLFNGTILSMQTIYAGLFALASGIITAVLVSGGIPLIETIFDYTTDIKLLELTNLNSPLLKDLMVRAPGTYHHSVIVGNLAETAAEAINANPLLARVAAYYHDIGKTGKAQYFIENQCGCENRHDKLAPSMSALILISHVKEGAELARVHHLGKPVIDIIRQSHGTALIKYFYQKAKEQSPPDQFIDEHEFRYPGPKPQTREAGIVLLADCVEAASRTLNNPTPARIQGLVQKIVNNIFTDGQLDECELTLKNLHEIAWSFNQILSGIYHHRIDYPQTAYKEKLPGGKKQSDHYHSEPPKTSENRAKRAENCRGEDLKRLGMSLL